MGTWGAGLYQNDISDDVRTEFQELFNEQGMNAESITEKLLEEYKPLMGVKEEEPLFWFALAETQWRYGVLMPEVKQKALEWIKRNPELQDVQIIDKKTAHKKWPVTLQKLEEKLNSPMPKERKPKKKKPRQVIWPCDWNVGDVYAYPLENDKAREKGLNGRYLLIRMIDEVTLYANGYPIGCRCPVVYIKITDDSTLPSSAADYEKMEYVQVKFTRYEQRFFPIHFNRLEEDMKAKMAMKYDVDEYGYLPQFRAIILNGRQNKGKVPPQLIYWGRIEKAEPPNKEFIPLDKGNWKHVFWNDFENEMIDQYCRHNLRQSTIYQKDK